MKKYTVIHSRDKRDLEQLTSAARSLWGPTDKLVFVRTGVPSTPEEVSKLTLELKALGLLVKSYAAILVDKESISEALAKRGIAIGFFLGPNPEFSYMNRTEREKLALMQDTVTYRWASVCRKCECIINERITEQPRKEAEALLKNAPAGVEVSRTDKLFSFIETSETCRVC